MWYLGKGTSRGLYTAVLVITSLEYWKYLIIVLDYQINLNQIDWNTIMIEHI
jgi:hypothetical protein